MQTQLRFAQSAGALATGRSWNREQAAAFHRRRLMDLVRHSYAHTPFYRALWKAAGAEPGDIRTMEDFRRLPIFTKSQLQDAGTKIVSDQVPSSRLQVHHTGGSSGQPIEIRRTHYEDKLLQAIRVRRLMQMYGLRWTDRRGSIRVDRKKWNPGFYARLGILRARTVDCRLPADDQAQRLIAYSPDYLSGYPASLARVADRVGGLLPKLRCVISAGDTLTREHREQIEAGFRKPLWDVYGAHECNLLALSCSGGAFHVAEEAVYLEVIRADGKPAEAGEQGEAVITALHTFSAPIVRFRLGDLLVPGEPCACGVSGRTLTKIVGRTSDLFERPDGSTYHPLEIVLPLQSIGRGLIRTFRVTQHSPERMTILIEPMGEFSEQRIEQVRRSTQDAVGHAIDLEVRLAQNLTAEPNGKFRSFCRDSTPSAS